MNIPKDIIDIILDYWTPWSIVYDDDMLCKEDDDKLYFDKRLGLQIDCNGRCTLRAMSGINSSFIADKKYNNECIRLGDICCDYVFKIKVNDPSIDIDILKEKTTVYLQIGTQGNRIASHGHGIDIIKNNDIYLITSDIIRYPIPLVSLQYHEVIYNIETDLDITIVGHKVTYISLKTKLRRNLARAGGYFGPSRCFRFEKGMGGLVNKNPKITKDSLRKDKLYFGNNYLIYK